MCRRGFGSFVLSFAPLFGIGNGTWDNNIWALDFRKNHKQGLNLYLFRA